jgi:programmed cell death 6-interacting protein
VFSYIRTELLPTIEREQSSHSLTTAKPTSMGQDMTPSFLGALEKFCLAEAQECFWQRAVLEKYKNGLIAKLAIQVGFLDVVCGARLIVVRHRCRSTMRLR